MDSNHEESRPLKISKLLILKSPASPESQKNTAICTVFVQERRCISQPNGIGCFDPTNSSPRLEVL
jgi:hypothetical protein